jgi:hypothetical protein
MSFSFKISPERVCDADNSPSPSAEVKNDWRHTSTLPIRPHGVVLSEAQGNLYFYPYLTQKELVFSFKPSYSSRLFNCFAFDAFEVHCEK